MKSFAKHRPRYLTAIYVEENQIEVLQAHRLWRSWEIDNSEKFTIPEGESYFDSLQRLNLRPKSAGTSALILFLPRTLYSSHLEHYPAALQDQLEHALIYDWQENAFHEPDRARYFCGQAVPIDHHVAVPIFSLQNEIYDKFEQVLGASNYRSFTVIPAAMLYISLLKEINEGAESDPLEILARIIDPDSLEISRFYEGHLLDSVVVRKGQNILRLFLEGLVCVTDETCQASPHLHLFCTDEDCAPAMEDRNRWSEEGLPIRLESLPKPLLTYWVEHLLEQEQVKFFDSELVLKPWQVPRPVWAMLGVIFLYLILGVYQSASLGWLQDDSKKLKKQILQMETQWKPVEQLQTRISKFQEDKKTVTAFNREGYPLLQILTLLTRVTPEDTSLNYLSVRKDQLILRGDSKSAIKFLSELSKIEGFNDVKFASPVTRNPTSDQERFNVQAQLDPEKLGKVFESMGIEKETGKAEPTPSDAPAAASLAEPGTPTEPGQESQGFDDQESEQELEQESEGVE